MTELDRAAALLDRLIDPAVAFAADPAEPLGPAARSAFAGREWTTLAEVYQRAAEQAWRSGRQAAALRLLLAERGAARRTGNQHRLHQAIAFLAMRHRLCGGFTAAERWNLVVLRTRLDESTALIHAQAWREMAALREVAGRYADGRECCDRALAICSDHAGLTGIRIRQVKALLQRAVLERQQGDLAAAHDTLSEARELAGSDEVDAHTRGLVELREGGLELILGRPALALGAFRRAAPAFQGVSENNFLLVRLREVACLRALNRLAEALEITDELAVRFRGTGGSAYRLGQVMLERAEVYEEIGDHDGVAAALAEVEPYYSGSTTLEAVRWHRHAARHLIHVGGDQATAARHLATALDVVAGPDRADLTRTMMALHDLLRLRGDPVLAAPLRSAVWRAALLAADVQRTSLAEPATRWSLHALREEVYATAVLVGTEDADAGTAAQIAETGRADVLNHVLTASADRRAALIAAERLDLPGPDCGPTDRIFTVARLAAESILFGRAPAALPALPLPGELPPSAGLDLMADLVVMITMGRSPDGWWSAVITRRREGDWLATVRSAGPDLIRLINRLASGRHLPARGVTRDLRDQLGGFLLPDPRIWAGTPDAPQSLVIVPDPRLWHLPLAALARDGVLLNDVAEVTLTPSLRTLHLLRRRAAEPRPAVGRPVLSHLDTALPGATVEQAALDDWPDGHEELPDLAACRRDTSLLYVSGHGTSAGATPHFGPATISLDALAAAALPRLVVLNGCWSGTAVSQFGQDPLSLAVGALLGGADTVIAGVGRVGSVPSAHIGAAFIGLVRDGMPAAAALRVAQRRMRDAHPDLGPFDWAGLCAVGIGH